ncbi:hypothetical protein [Pelomonas cellulosilytica]|uniref:Uncharacterized protein n=1 Tax=Pelomonas cellulosilytica TaxID=2906762 RepID=A0ABS8XVB1_9BURK|nr:hypothetical protein [Pelomonas sp. P8]MCE4554654.1 hypothetical protein [Pelomonas sp. P8]
METTQTTFQTLSRGLKISAAVVTAFVALAQPQVALAGDAGFSSGVVAAERFRAADNGSAEVKIATAATVRPSIAATELKGAELQMAGGAADRRFTDRKFTDRRFTDRKFTDRRFGDVGYSADRKFDFRD